MKQEGALTRILALVGTVLVWFPLLATVVTAVVASIAMRRFLCDYLMPAELFPAVLLGGGLLLWAALRARSRRALIGWGLGVAAGVLVGGQALAVATGLASGAIPPEGVWWALAVASLVIYTLAVAELGTASVLLSRDLFARDSRSRGLTPPA